MDTDGSTEARDREHGFLPIERVRGWLLAADPRNPRRFVEAIPARVSH